MICYAGWLLKTNEAAEPICNSEFIYISLPDLSLDRERELSIHRVPCGQLYENTIGNMTTKLCGNTLSPTGLPDKGGNSADSEPNRHSWIFRCWI